jgi:hypothetical protein
VDRGRYIEWQIAFKKFSAKNWPTNSDLEPLDISIWSSHP